MSIPANSSSPSPSSTGERKFPFGVAPTTPEAIDDTLRTFAAEALSPTEDPVFVPVETDADSLPLDCFSNVQRRIQRQGGGKRRGWVVWQHGDSMIEAEFHCVWVAPDGRLVDVTPHDGESLVVFVPDKTVRATAREQNRRRALRPDKEIEDKIKSIEAQYAQREALYRNPPPWVKIEEPPIFVARIGRNDECPCGSGRKYKKCCLRLNDD